MSKSSQRHFCVAKSGSVGWGAGARGGVEGKNDEMRGQILMFSKIARIISSARHLGGRLDVIIIILLYLPQKLQ